MEPEEALADLAGISADVEAAVILDSSGGVVASTLASGERSREIGRVATELLATADGVRGRPELPVSELEIALRAGSVFLIRRPGHAIVATTQPRPPSGLVLYDLRECLGSLTPGGEASDAA